jgi:hypothetical protein
MLFDFAGMRTMTIPTGPGPGIKDVAGLLKDVEID